MTSDRNRIALFALVSAMVLGPAVMFGKCVLRPAGDDFGKIDSRVSMGIALITVDRLHPSQLHPYDKSLPTQPGLDEMARLGVTCKLTFAASNGEPRAAASILTGQMPSTLGVLDWGDKLPPGTFTLAKVLKARGFATGAFTNAPLLSLTGLGADFTTGHEDLNAGSVELSDAVAKWLATVGQTPFFLWVHCSPDPAIAGGRDADPAQVFDRIVQDVSAALTRARWYEGTLLIAAGAYDDPDGELQVPLLWKVPKRNTTNVTRDGPCSLLDVVPTLLDLLNMNVGPRSPGRSLWSRPDGNAPLSSGYHFTDRAIFERYIGSSREPVIGMRIAQYELTYGPRPNGAVLVDRSPGANSGLNLANNPKFKDKIDGKDGLLQDLFERRKHGPPPQIAGRAPPMSEETRAILERRAR